MNDVLATTPSVERYKRGVPQDAAQDAAQDPQTTPGLGGCYREYHMALERERRTVRLLKYALKIPEDLLTYAIDSLEQRIWVAQIDEAVSVLNILASHHWRFDSLLAGFVVLKSTTWMVKVCGQGLGRLQLLQRSLSILRASVKRRAVVRQWAGTLTQM